PAPAPPADPSALRPLDGLADDRDALDPGSRVILVVEDDLPFARILRDLVHELGFKCVVTTTADDGVLAARRYLPHAVILDMGLPDHSGMTVLDRMKRDVATRHIPVHVVSANDYVETAMSYGAAAFMLKPVKREELASALDRLETRLSQPMRRILIVEDDPAQRLGLGELLATKDVETVGVASAAEALARLGAETFDCMVLDMTLPDASGLDLLEQLDADEGASFPPVIVYTARDLTADEELRLRRYSKSIIIKGAKSPERLIDEVTLFLHQVVSDLPERQQRLLAASLNRDALLDGRRILVVEDDVRNVFAITSIFEPHGAAVQIARNGREALQALDRVESEGASSIDLVLMDVMMPEMDGLTATREIRARPAWRGLPVIMLTAKAMADDQEECLAAGANDYLAKPLDVDKLLSLARVWMPR
ncbi:response regulator, partial [Ancylobacter sp. G4_0304]|uniref:response regulator n=1 Tax=Ancylobacter sp. G4_0304 TaxID=3114289 RepID=UPI0039C61DB7